MRSRQTKRTTSKILENNGNMFRGTRAKSSDAPSIRWNRRALLLSQITFSAVLLWYLIRYYFGDYYPYLGYINAGGFFFGLFSLVAGLWMLWRRAWFWSIPACALGLAVLEPGLAYNFANSEDGAEDRQIRVVTASLRTANRDMAAAAANLLSFRPDIVTVQEASDPSDLADAFRGRSAAGWHFRSLGSFVVLSRFPMELPKQPKGVLAVRVTLPSGRKLSVWNLRAPKEYDDPITNSLFFSQLTEDIKAFSPDVVAGDFNSTPWNEGYGEMTNLLRDSFREAGLGTGFTFPAPGRRMGKLLPLIRIDHIFVRPNIRVLSAATGSASPGADHYPLIVELIP